MHQVLGPELAQPRSQLPHDSAGGDLWDATAAANVARQVPSCTELHGQEHVAALLQHTEHRIVCRHDPKVQVTLCPLVLLRHKM